jgi:hypothetical protein
MRKLGPPFWLSPQGSVGRELHRLGAEIEELVREEASETNVGAERGKR